MLAGRVGLVAAIGGNAASGHEASKSAASTAHQKHQTPHQDAAAWLELRTLGRRGAFGGAIAGRRPYFLSVKST